MTLSREALNYVMDLPIDPSDVYRASVEEKMVEDYEAGIKPRKKMRYYFYLDDSLWSVENIHVAQHIKGFAKENGLYFRFICARNFNQ